MGSIGSGLPTASGIRPYSNKWNAGVIHSTGETTKQQCTAEETTQQQHKTAEDTTNPKPQTAAPNSRGYHQTAACLKGRAAPFPSGAGASPISVSRLVRGADPFPPGAEIPYFSAIPAPLPFPSGAAPFPSGAGIPCFFLPAFFKSTVEQGHAAAELQVSNGTERFHAGP